MTREHFPNRRFAETVSFSLGAQRYIATVGRLSSGKFGELFLNTHMKAGSEADTNAVDGALAVSLALQYGCPLETLRSGMKRNEDGSPQGPLGAALDKMRDIE